MLEINGLTIECSILQVINDLKVALERNGIKLLGSIKPTPNNIMVSCPSHKDGQERKPSCGISTVDTWRGDTKFPAGTVHCFTCGYTATLTEFISLCFGYRDGGIFGNKWLKMNYVTTITRKRRTFNLDISRRETVKELPTITDDILDKYRYDHDYMFKRGLTEDIIDEFDIGYDIENDCITLPVRNLKGEVKFIQTRSIKNKFYYIPEGVTKTDFLYGAYECLKYNKDNKPVWIVESIFNALTLWKYGEYAIALLSTGGGNQYDMLSKLPFRHYIIALDNDDAGYAGTNKLCQRLGRYKLLSTVQYNNSTDDINDLQEKVLDLKIIPENF